MDRVQGIEHIHKTTLLLCSKHLSEKKKTQQCQHPLCVGKVPELAAVNYILCKCAMMTLIFSLKWQYYPSV